MNEEEELISVKDRADKSPAAQVRASPYVRVIGNELISRIDPIAKPLEHRLHLPVAGEGVARQRRAVGEKPPPGIEEGRAEAEKLRGRIVLAAAHDNLGHLPGDGAQAVVPAP